MKLYYRVHWRDCPEFSPENAESIDWGMRDSEVMCPRCKGNMYITKNDEEIECPDCKGTGLVSAEPVEGYSCCETPEDLFRYFNNRIEPDDDEVVIEFTGRVVGYGTDNEPLVIPDMKHARRMTWKEFNSSLI